MSRFTRGEHHYHGVPPVRCDIDHEARMTDRSNVERVERAQEARRAKGRETVHPADPCDDIATYGATIPGFPALPPDPYLP